MYFCDLAIRASSKAVLPRGHTVRDLKTRHISDIFVSFMPNRYVLDGMRKTNLSLGPCEHTQLYVQLINVNMCFVEDFDFDKYFRSSDTDRDSQILNTVEVTLAELAETFSSDPQPIHVAATKTRDCVFERIARVKALCRSSPDRRYRINVLIRLRRTGESWIVEVTDRNGAVVWKSIIVEDTFGLAPRYDYRKSLWSGNNFVLLDRFDRVKFALDWGILRNEIAQSAP